MIESIADFNNDMSKHKMSSKVLGLESYSPAFIYNGEWGLYY